MKGFLVTLLLLGNLAFPAQTAASERPWLDSVEEAMAEAQRTGNPILVDLYADWCGWCKRLEAEVFSTPAFQQFAEDFVLLRVDTEDGAEGTRLQQRYESFSLPTTLVLDRDGIMIASVKGFAPARQYIGRIETEIEVFYELVQGYERFGQSSDPRVLGILADEFHKRNDGKRAAELYRQLLTSTETTPEKSIRIRYQIVDALRLAKKFDDALLELEAVRSSTTPGVDTFMDERFDLLAAQLAIEMGDCENAQTALEAFLGNYPASELLQVARQTLATLKAEGYRCS